MSTPVSRIKNNTRAAQAALVSSASNAVITSLISHAPFFGWIVIRPFIQFFIKKILEFLTDKGILYFNVVWVRMKVSADAAELEEARQRAVKAVDENKSNEELDKLDQELIDAFKKLNRYGRGPL